MRHYCKSHNRLSSFYTIDFCPLHNNFLKLPSTAFLIDAKIRRDHLSRQMTFLLKSIPWNMEKAPHLDLIEIVWLYQLSKLLRQERSKGPCGRWNKTTPEAVADSASLAVLGKSGATPEGDFRILAIAENIALWKRAHKRLCPAFRLMLTPFCPQKNKIIIIEVLTKLTSSLFFALHILKYELCSTHNYRQLSIPFATSLWHFASSFCIS